MLTNSCSVVLAETLSQPNNAELYSTPSNLRLSTADKKPVLQKGVTAETQLTATWDAVPQADHYLVYLSNNVTPTPIRLLLINNTGSVVGVKTFDPTFTYELKKGDGIYNLAVSAVDEYGVESAKSATYSLNLDTTSPRIYIVNPRDYIELTGNSVTVQGNITDKNLDYYFFTLKAEAAETTLTSALFTESVRDGIIASLDVSEFDAGRYRVSFVAVDKAGHQTVVSASDEAATFELLRKSDGAPVPSSVSLAGIQPMVPTVIPVAPRQLAMTSVTDLRTATSPVVLGATDFQSLASQNFVSPVELAPYRESLAVTTPKINSTPLWLIYAVVPLMIPVILTITRRLKPAEQTIKE